MYLLFSTQNLLTMLLTAVRIWKTLPLASAAQEGVLCSVKRRGLCFWQALSGHDIANNCDVLPVEVIPTFSTCKTRTKSVQFGTVNDGLFGFLWGMVSVNPQQQTHSDPYQRAQVGIDLIYFSTFCSISFFYLPVLFIGKPKERSWNHYQFPQQAV